MTGNSRVLANIILHRGGIYKNTIIEIKGDNSIVLTPFERETASTTFLSGIVAVCDSLMLTPEHVQNLQAIASRRRELRSLSDIADDLNTYLSANNLYHNSPSLPQIVNL